MSPSELPFLVIQIFNLLLILGYPLLSILALFQLRRRKLESLPTALWALVILVPYLGPLAFWLLAPRGSAETTK
ncbi:MAG: PLDc N-terminal domain-containing protein [Anaerolineales bacterium]